MYVCILCFYYTALWCKILQVGGSLLGSAARVFLARMCAGMAARPVCARTVRAQIPILESYDGYFDCFASFVSIISQYSFVVRGAAQDCAL